MLTRTQIAIASVTVAAVGLSIGLYLESPPPGHPNLDQDVPLAGVSKSVANEAAPAASEIALGRHQEMEKEPKNTPATTHRAYVAERIAVLQDLSMDNRDSSLRTILGELSNRDPEIRKAAREAAVQFASRDAIPGLLEAAAQTDDPAEKKELIEAADFLKLPSLTEVLDRRGIKLVLTAKPAPGKQFPAFSRKLAPQPQPPSTN